MAGRGQRDGGAGGSSDGGAAAVGAGAEGRGGCSIPSHGARHFCRTKLPLCLAG